LFAVIESGGKQHRVAQGDVVRLEKIRPANEGESLTPGSSVQFDQILMMSGADQVVAGTPHVEGGLVEGELLSEGRGEKVRVVKFKRRKNYLRRQGHRQAYSEVRITKIQLPAASGSA